MPKAGGKSFERDMVRAFNVYFLENGIDALAYRRWAPERSHQEFDLVCDSADIGFYLAIECKSVSEQSTKALYFKSHFSAPNGNHQLDRERDWLRRTGRIGLLAVEIRAGKGKQREAYMIPFMEVMDVYRAGATGLPLANVRHYIPVPRINKQYEITESVIDCIELP